MAIFKGCGVAIVTPMGHDESVDYKAFGELIDWQINEGVNAIIVCGTTGEASTLSDEEHVDVCKFCVDRVNKRVPVIAGAGSNNTCHAVTMAREMENIGADGLLLVTPYYNKCSQEGLIKHFFAIADSVNIPSIVYSVPGRTGVNILPKTVLELSKHKNIVGIKEATGNISQVAEILRLVPPSFGVYSGNDDMVVPMLSLGGIGYISVLANVAPKAATEMTENWFDGNIKGACSLQLSLKPLIDVLFSDVNPIPVKVALNMMGKTEINMRLPLCPPNAATTEKIKRTLIEYKLIG